MLGPSSRSAVWALSAVVLAACSVVKATRLRDDWLAVDAQKVKRLAVVVQPLPAGDETAGAVFAKVARRYVNQKRDFLVKQDVAQAGPVDLSVLCGGEGAIEGVLRLDVKLDRKGEGFEAQLRASLVRCGDGQEDWAVESAGSFPAKDALLTEVTAAYARELGAGAEPYVAPAMNLLRPSLDTLPQPRLSEDDVTEKMSLDD